MKHRPKEKRRAGFSMLELLLVVVIVLLTTLLAVPSFVRSFRGARLRTSARTVVMAHRHARSTAILQQKHVAMLLDTEKSQLEIVTVSDARDTAARDRFLDGRGSGMEGEGGASVESDLARRLENQIRIADFDSERVGQEVDGIYWVNYFPNGMCDDFSMQLVDEKGRYVEVDVDPYSGRITLEERSR